MQRSFIALADLQGVSCALKASMTICDTFVLHKYYVLCVIVSVYVANCPDYRIDN